MTSLHMKGFMLQLLYRQGQMWDYDVADSVMREYGYAGDYWYGTVRLTLTDLYSGGLLEELDTKVDPEKSHGVERVLFKYALSDFGRQRTRQAGLLTTGEEVTK